MELAIGVVGLVIAWLTYQKTFLSQPTEEKENLLLNIRANQRLSREVLEELTTFGEQNNAFDEIMFCKIPLGKYIHLMRTEHAKNLSEEIYQNIKNSKLSKATINSMMDSIMAQQADLISVQTAIKMYMKE